MSDKKRESLDEFEERFGELADRFELSTDERLERRDLPLAQTPERAAEEQAANEPTVYQEPYRPDLSSQSSFDQAANNTPDQSQVSVDSQMVGEDAPENNLPPPEDSQNIDREAHYDRMAQDDDRSKSDIADDYIKRFEQHMENETLPSYDQEQDQGYEQSR